MYLALLPPALRFSSSGPRAPGGPLLGRRRPTWRLPMAAAQKAAATATAAAAVAAAQ